MRFGEKLVDVLSWLIMGLVTIATEIENYVAVFLKAANAIATILTAPLEMFIGILIRVSHLFSEEALKEAALKNKLIAAIVKTL